MWFFLLVFWLFASLIGFKKKTFLLVFSNVLVCISKVCRPSEFLIWWSATLLFFNYKPNCCQTLCCYWEYRNVPKMEKNLRWHPSQTPRVLRLSFLDAEESYQNKVLAVGIIQGELLWRQLPYWALRWDHMACLRPARANDMNQVYLKHVSNYLGISLRGNVNRYKSWKERTTIKNKQNSGPSPHNRAGVR